MIKRAPPLPAVCGVLFCLVWAGFANAQETEPPRPIEAIDFDQADPADDEPPPVPPYRLHARILVGEREMWAGNLAMTNYGRAYVRSFIQDMDANCPLKNHRFQVREHTIDLSVAPGSREGPYLYSVEANWTSPAEACSDKGARATGVRVEIDLSENQSRVIEGERGLRVEVTRLP